MHLNTIVRAKIERNQVQQQHYIMLMQMGLSYQEYITIFKNNLFCDKICGDFITCKKYGFGQVFE